MSKIAFILSLFVFALIIWSPTNAEPPPGIVKYTYWIPPKDVYPWDKTTHPDCSDENREEKPPFCKKGSDWPDFDTTWKRVNLLISRNSTHILTKAEKDLVNNSKRFPTGEYMFEAWNQAMKYFAARDDNGKREEISEVWIAEQKGEGFCIMTRAILQYSKGTDHRYFNIYEPEKNLPEAIANFRKSLKSADKILDSASDNIKKTALWFEYKLKIAYQLPELHKSAAELFAKAIRYWPEYPDIYKLAYVYSHPEHGGSYQAMKKVIGTALKNTRKRIGSAMYPLIITSSWNVPGFDFKLTFSKMDWSLMRQGFKDYENHLGGSLKYFYYFAELACKKQDQETTRHFYERHTNRVMERGKDDPFVDRVLSQENECRDWALAGKKRRLNLTRLERQKINNYNLDVKTRAKVVNGNGSDKPNSAKPNTQQKWATYEESNKRLQNIFSINDASNDLNVIQKAEESIAYSSKRFETGEYYFEPWIDYINYHFKGSYLFEPAFENPRAKFIDKWIEYQKGEGYSVIAKAIALYGKATDNFNSRYPKRNSPGTLINYAKYLLETNSVLDSASDKIKQTAVWHEYKLKVAYQHPILRRGKEKLLADAIRAWPEYPAIYAIAYAYSSPKWGGSYKEMNAIAKLAVEKTQKRLGVAMYPQVIFEARLQNLGFEIPYQIIEWDLMKQGFRDYEKHFGGNSYMYNWFVDTACKMGDQQEARRLFPLYDRSMKGKINNSISACREFAFSKDSEPSQLQRIEKMNPAI